MVNFIVLKAAFLSLYRLLCTSAESLFSEVSAMVLVDCYRNLHKGALAYSLRIAESRGNARKGIVIGHGDTVTVYNALFLVNQKGRERVLARKRKEVHATVRGLVSLDRAPVTISTEYVEITYNPFRYTSFVEKATGRAIKGAAVVHMTKQGVFARKVEYL